MRLLANHYQIGIETEQAIGTVPDDLAALLGRRPADVSVILDLSGPGRGRFRKVAIGSTSLFWDFSTMPKSWQVPLLNGADSLWVNSDAQLQGFTADRYPTNRMTVLAPGYDAAVFSPTGPVAICRKVPRAGGSCSSVI